MATLKEIADLAGVSRGTVDKTQFFTFCKIRIKSHNRNLLFMLHAIYMANRSVSGCTEAVKTAGRKGEVRIICHDPSS